MNTILSRLSIGGYPSKKGFTLVEIVVVIAIIGVLFAIIYAGLSDSRKASRDSRRLADLKQIQNALNLYIETCRQYPPTLSVSENTGCPSGITLGTYIRSIPTDPLNSGLYVYTYSAQRGGGSGSTCLNYRLHTRLEVTNHQALSADLDDGALSSGGTCTGGVNDIDGADPVYELAP